MMPLNMSKPGATCAVTRVQGKDSTRQFLEKLGFVPGEAVQVISENGGSLIVNVKNCRVALSRDMALKIMV